MEAEYNIFDTKSWETGAKKEQERKLKRKIKMNKKILTNTD